MQPIDTTQIAQNFYIQFGAVALLAGAGWGVAWLLWRRLMALQDRYDALSREVMIQAAGLNETARQLAQVKELKEFIKDTLRDS